MSEQQAETATVSCAQEACTCVVAEDGGFVHEGRRYCSSQCADPSVQGCGHPGCPCN